MKKLLIFASFISSFSCLANQFNPYMPYEKPKLIEKANINPIEAGMSGSDEFVDNEGNSISASNITFIMEIDGVDVFLDKDTGMYINKKSDDNDNK